MKNNDLIMTIAKDLTVAVIARDDAFPQSSMSTKDVRLIDLGNNAMVIFSTILDELRALPEEPRTPSS